MSTGPNPYQTTSEVGSSSLQYGSNQVKIRRVGILSLGAFMGAAGAVLGLIGSGFFVLFSIIGAVAESNGGSPGTTVAMGIGMAIGAPLIYGFLFFVMGLIYGLIFNVVAGMTGGLEIELSH